MTKETVSAAFDPEQLGQLGQRDRQSRTGLEAESRPGGQCSARRIATRHSRDRDSDKRRDRRGQSESKLSRRAKNAWNKLPTR